MPKVKNPFDIIMEFIRTLDEAVLILRECSSVRRVGEAVRCKEDTMRLQMKADRLLSEYQSAKRHGKK